MSKYTGKPVTVNASAEVIAEKFADLSVLQSNIDKLPESERARLGQTTFEKDAIVIVNPQVGQLRFEVVERTPQTIRMASAGMLPMSMNVDMEPVDGGEKTSVTTSIEIQLPAMLRPFVGPQLQKAADQFGVLMAKIATGDGL